MKKTFSLVLVLFLTVNLYSQDTLPKFSLTERGGRVTISWTNPYNTLIQLNVQRSYDSLKYFTTIFSATSPELPVNGYTDTKKTANRIFYRIFYVLQGGSYFFTRVKKADGTETGSLHEFPAINSNSDKSRDNTPDFTNVVPGDKRTVTIRIKDAPSRQLSINAFKNFRDSVLRLTRDTLYSINDSLVSLNPYVAREEFRASIYVYLNKDGYINISLPSISQKKYHIKFFEENGASLFDINNVKESPLIIDKTSFVHAGWFLFELYEDNKLKEKNRFYLPKDF